MANKIQQYQEATKSRQFSEKKLKVTSRLGKSRLSSNLEKFQEPSQFQNMHKKILKEIK